MFLGVPALCCPCGLIGCSPSNDEQEAREAEQEARDGRQEAREAEQEARDGRAQEEKQAMLLDKDRVVTENKVVIAENAKQADLLNRIFETSHDALMLCQLPDAEDKPPLVLRSSPSIHAVLGLDTGADPFSAFTAEQQADIGKDVACLREKGFFPERTKTLAHSGTIINCSGHMVDEARFLVTMRNVTEAKHNHERATIFRTLTLDNSFDLVTEIVVEAGVSTRLWSSESHRKILGHDPVSCNGDERTLTKLYTPEFIQLLPSLVSQVEAGDMPDGFTTEVAYLHARGHTVWFESRIKYDTNKKNRFLVVSRDITDRHARQRLEVEKATNAERERAMVEKEAAVAEKERALKEKEAVSSKFAYTLDELGDVVFTATATSWEAADWRVAERSKSFAQLFRSGDAPLLDLVDDSRALAALLAGARDISAASKGELTVVRPTDGEARTLDVRAVDISAREGRTSVLVVCHDLTDFKFRIEAEKDRQVAAKLQHEVRKRFF